VNGEQAMFIADRELRASRYLHLDPFMLPGAGSGRITGRITDGRADALERSLGSLTGDAANVFGRGSMSLFNVGDSSLEVTELSGAEAASSSDPQRSADTKKTLWTSNPGVKIASAVRCTSAAPTYFPPARVVDFWRHELPDGTVVHEDLVAADGALVNNNPALIALMYTASLDARIHSERLRAAKHMLDDYVVLSLGSGTALGLESVEKLASQSSMLSWITGSNSIINVLMSNSPAASHYTLDSLYSLLAHFHNDPQLVKQYLRVQLAVDKRAKPGEPGYAPAEVALAIANPNHNKP
jgi:hypothetical protein